MQHSKVREDALECKRPPEPRGSGGLPVGVAGFEPTASSSRTKRATKLRHTPVPFEYSLTPSIFPNGDGVSARSVVHAACCQAASSHRKPGSRMPSYAGCTYSSDASGRVAMRIFA